MATAQLVEQSAVVLLLPLLLPLLLLSAAVLSASGARAQRSGARMWPRPASDGPKAKSSFTKSIHR